MFIKISSKLIYLFKHKLNLHFILSLYQMNPSAWFEHTDRKDEYPIVLYTNLSARTSWVHPQLCRATFLSFDMKSMAKIT